MRQPDAFAAAAWRSRSWVATLRLPRSRAEADKPTCADGRVLGAGEVGAKIAAPRLN